MNSNIHAFLKGQLTFEQLADLAIEAGWTLEQLDVAIAAAVKKL